MAGQCIYKVGFPASYYKIIPYLSDLQFNIVGPGVVHICKVLLLSVAREGKAYEKSALNCRYESSEQKFSLLACAHI